MRAFRKILKEKELRESAENATLEESEIESSSDEELFQKKVNAFDLVFYFSLNGFWRDKLNLGDDNDQESEEDEIELKSHEIELESHEIVVDNVIPHPSNPHSERF